MKINKPPRPWLTWKGWKQRVSEEEERIGRLTGDERKHAEQAAKDRRVHPADAPRGTLRAKLIAQMTSTESSSKTAASDLLFNLCGDEGAGDGGACS